MTRKPGLLRRWRHLLLAVFVLAWIASYVVTHVPIAPILREMNLSLSDVIYHAVGYFGLSMLLFLVMLAYGVRPATRAVGLLAIMAVYGAFDEISQGWVGRDPDVGDWLADMLGVITAWLTGRALASLGASSGLADPAD